MINQAVIEEIYITTTVNLEQTTGTGKTQTPNTTKTGLKVFLMGKDGDLSVGVVAGMSFIGYLFTDQLGVTNLSLNDKLIDGTTIYEVVGIRLMNQNLDFEPYYKLDLEKRIKST